jgi:threonine synthase
MYNLYCTNCTKEYAPETIYPRCSACNEPLEVRIHDIAGARIKKKFNILERYEDFLPQCKKVQHLSLGEGRTPLTLSRWAVDVIGLNSLYFKNESLNPTWSFKDRGTIVGLCHGVSLGFSQFGTVSTGNMASSVAAYCKANGMNAFIMVSKGLPSNKIAPIGIYDPQLIVVEGDYGALYFESIKIAQEKGIYFINSDVPHRVEGSKTIAFEICEQLNFEPPDFVVVPTSAAGNARGILKGFEEFFAVGLIDHIPKVVVAQAKGCAPIYQAWKKQKLEISRIENPETIAHAIENPFPPSGNAILRKIKEHNGIVSQVSDEEILTAQALMAKDGIFGQPASAVPLAVVKKLTASGIIKSQDRVVCIVTGGGLKYPQALEKHDMKVETCKLSKLSQLIGNLKQ